MEVGVSDTQKIRIARTGGVCSICKIPYKIGDEQRLYLTEWGIEGAHESCAANAKMKVVCVRCKADAPIQRICSCGSDSRVVEIIT